jgi:glycosyl transferase family 25
MADEKNKMIISFKIQNLKNIINKKKIQNLKKKIVIPKKNNNLIPRRNINNILKQRNIKNNIFIPRRNVKNNIFIQRKNTIKTRIDIRKCLQKPNTHKHNIEKQNKDKSNIEKSNIEKSNIEKSNIEKSNITKLNIEKHNIPKLNIEKPNIRKLNIEKLNAEKPNAEKPNVHKPNIQKPIIQKPNIYNQNVSKSNIEKPNIEKPNIPKSNIPKPNIKKLKSNLLNLNLINKNITTDNLFPFIEKVIYINLEERVDRKKKLLEQLKRFPDNKIIRFNAIKEIPGYIGCTKSHIAALEIAIENNWSNCLIVEDDMIWSNFHRGYKHLENLIKSPYDVISLGSTSARYDKETFKLIKGKTTTAYLVNNHYYSILLENFKEGLEKLYENNNNDNYSKYALDEYWGILQKEDNWYVVSPALTIQSAGFSNIQNRKVNYESWFN